MVDHKDINKVNSDISSIRLTKQSIRLSRLIKYTDINI